MNIGSVDDLVLFLTSAGLIGFAPATTAPGDIIVYVPNIFPFMLLRPTGGTFEFRAFAYVHHAMTPEFWESFDMAKVAQVNVLLSDEFY